MKTGASPRAFGRVLIVDDEAETRTMVERVLKKLWPGIETALAGDGIQAVRVAEEFLPDILVLDLMLPGQDGFAVLRSLKNHRKLKSSLVLGITAYNSPANIKRLVDGGALSCLTKPFGPQELQKWLSPYLGGELVEGSLPGRKPNRKGRGRLLNLAAFLGFMVSTLQPRDLRASSPPLAKTTQIEERYDEEALPLRRIAILPFESSNPYLPGPNFCDYLTVEILRRVDGLEIVERKDLLKILEEQKLSLTGILRGDKASKLGSMLDVDAILIGSVRTLEPVHSVGGTISVSVKLIDVASGRVLWADKQKIAHATWSVRDLSEVAEALMSKSTKKLAKRVKTHLDALDRGRS